MILKSLAELLEGMERDLKRIDWQDVAILCATAVIVLLLIIGVVFGWW